MPADLFPSTQRTWLEERLAEGAEGLAQARAHVMARSHAALVAYVRGARVEVLGEPEEIVHDFFARRLAETDYLARWHASGLTLRRWLMNGVSAHIRDLWRRRRSDVRARAGEAEGAHGAFDGASDGASGEASHAFERAWIQATLGEACARVEQRLVSAGEADVWRAFVAHVLEGQSYRAILDAEQGRHGRAPGPGRDAEMTEDQLAVATRRVLRLLRTEIRAILRGDGIPESGLEAEIDRMVEGLGP